jgi:hypothetical protein
MDCSKTETILRMLVLLSGGNRYTVPELSMHFSRSERTVYRDLDTICKWLNHKLLPPRLDAVSVGSGVDVNASVGTIWTVSLKGGIHCFDAF